MSVLLFVGVFLSSTYGSNPECLSRQLLQAMDKFPQYRKFIDDVPFGIEVEGLISKKKLKALLKNMAKGLPSNASNIRINRKRNAGYGELSFVFDGRKYKWKVVDDISIVAEPGEAGVELVSPKLTDSKDKEVFQIVFREFKKAGMRPEPYSSGVHVHIDAENFSSAEFAVTAKLYSLLEKELFSKYMVTPSRARGWVKPNPIQVSNFIDIWLKSSMSIEYSVALKKIKKGYGLNLKALEKHGTVEFRFLNSTINEKAIEDFVEFGRKFIHSLRSKDPHLIKFLSKLDSDKPLSLEDFGKAIGHNLSDSNPIFFELQQEIARLEGGVQKSRNIPTTLVKLAIISTAVLAAIEAVTDLSEILGD